MHFVIMGRGRVGSSLAVSLEGRGHEVAVIDQDGSAFRRLGTNFEGRRQALLKQIEASKSGGQRTQGSSVVNLGADVASDAEVKKKVERIEPPGSASH